MSNLLDTGLISAAIISIPIIVLIALNRRKLLSNIEHDAISTANQNKNEKNDITVTKKMNYSQSAICEQTSAVIALIDVMRASAANNKEIKADALERFAIELENILSYVAPKKMSHALILESFTVIGYAADYGARLVPIYADGNLAVKSNKSALYANPVYVKNKAT